MNSCTVTEPSPSHATKAPGMGCLVQQISYRPAHDPFQRLVTPVLSDFRDLPRLRHLAWSASTCRT